MRIYLPNSAFLGNIESFLRKIDPTDRDRLEVTMHPKWVAVHPLVLSMIAALAHDVLSRGGSVSVQTEQVSSLPFLIRLGLYKQLQVEAPVNIREHESAGRFIPLTRIRTSRELTDFLTDMIPLLHTTPEQAQPIQYVMSELVRNVLEHSKSRFGASVCAQFFPKTSRLSIGIADTGIGIRKSMEHAHNVGNAHEALRLAMQPGVTGATVKPGGTEFNAGAGLFFVKSIATASRNFMVVHTDDAMFKLRKTPSSTTDIRLNFDPENDISTWREELPSWPGTAVGIDLSIEETVEFDSLLGAIRESYFSTVDEAVASYKKPRFD